MYYRPGINGTIEGVSVFGSAVVRVAPDSASIVVAVSRLDDRPEAAFDQAREGAQAVNGVLHDLENADYGSSRVTLSQESQYSNGEHRFVGYKAKIEFRVVLRELDKLDVLLTRLISAGANELSSVTFETSLLRELRADVRRRAVASARSKAELYCEAAGVAVGRVVAIEDTNPEVLSGRSEGHTSLERTTMDDTLEPGPIDPGVIAVGAAVNVIYEIIARE